MRKTSHYTKMQLQDLSKHLVYLFSIILIFIKEISPLIAL